MILRKISNSADFFMKPVFFCFFLALFFSPVKIMSRASLYTYSAKTAVSVNDPVAELAGPPADKPIVSKYAGLLKTDEAHVNKFIKLYGFIDDWLGTPYLWSGCKKSGIDCSCFVQTLFNDVFNIKIKRTSLAQFCDKDIELFTNRNEYQLGDLVFFKTNIARETRNNIVTHVGFYLTNGYFVQSSSAGVNIANLNRGYWKSRVVAAGRLKAAYYKKAGKAIPVGDIQNDPVMEVNENSTFDPVPFPEDLEYVINEYSAMLKINKDDIRYPEVFDFIEKNRYAPQNIISKCPKKLPGNNCLLSILYKDVFDIELEDPGKPDFFKNNTFYQGDNLKVARFLDLVKINPGKKNNQGIFSGIYLYNNYYLHISEGDIAISSLEDTVFNNCELLFYRFKPEITKAINTNIAEIRKGNRPAKANDPPPEAPATQESQHLLKKDTDSPGTAAMPQAPARVPVSKKKKRKKASR
jgi:murein DD-endopeptidase / murein LD-carboxypeptidase